MSSSDVLLDPLTATPTAPPPPSLEEAEESDESDARGEARLRICIKASLEYRLRSMSSADAEVIVDGGVSGVHEAADAAVGASGFHEQLEVALIGDQMLASGSAANPEPTGMEGKE